LATKAKTLSKIPCGGKHEKAARLNGYTCIAGVDEVGRGALFGPVFAAAVVLSPDRPIRGLRDSKQLDSETRELLTDRIRERAVSWAVGAADVFEIDRINIYQASKLAMSRAIAKLSPPCDYLLTDSMPLALGVPCESVLYGDAKVQCIAAASILAKTSRDRCMREWDAVFPQYGLARHKGYSTDEHIAALRDFGPTMLHRFSFEPVRAACSFPVWAGYDEKEKDLVQHATF
jgi:ribonuclease HII